jgi:hypothetical protein
MRPLVDPGQHHRGYHTEIFIHFISYSSPHATRPTNITKSSNRTIDYLTAAKPEAYQAHYRRISASKAANQPAKKSASDEHQEQQKHQQAKQGLEHKNESAQEKLEDSSLQQNINALACCHMESPESFAYDVQPDLDPSLPVNLRERLPKYTGRQPKSAPAVLHSRSEKTAIVQGEIPIGIEPSLSPLANMEMGC